MFRRVREVWEDLEGFEERGRVWNDLGRFEGGGRVWEGLVGFGMVWGG